MIESTLFLDQDESRYDLIREKAKTEGFAVQCEATVEQFDPGFEAIFIGDRYQQDPEHADSLAGVIRLLVSGDTPRDTPIVLTGTATKMVALAVSTLKEAGFTDVLPAPFALIILL